MDALLSLSRDLARASFTSIWILCVFECNYKGNTLRFIGLPMTTGSNIVKDVHVPLYIYYPTPHV